MKKCTYCGRENSDDTGTCCECGTTPGSELRKMRISLTTIAPSYERPFMAALASQGIALIASTIDPHTYHARVFMLSFLSYWVVAVTLVLLRPKSPRPGTLVFVALGFVFLYGAGHYLEQLIWSSREL